uniref:Uncharacterized protein n=1 Tax=Romanomermis culicivorax TaxID=13658 RepID=A0A915L0F3_ROMCU
MKKTHTFVDEAFRPKQHCGRRLPSKCTFLLGDVYPPVFGIFPGRRLPVHSVASPPVTRPYPPVIYSKIINSNLMYSLRETEFVTLWSNL